MKSLISLISLIAVACLTGCDTFTAGDGIRAASETVRLYRAARGLPPVEPPLPSSPQPANP